MAETNYKEKASELEKEKQEKEDEEAQSSLEEEAESYKASAMKNFHKGVKYVRAKKIRNKNRDYKDRHSKASLRKKLLNSVGLNRANNPQYQSYGNYHPFDNEDFSGQVT